MHLSRHTESDESLLTHNLPFIEIYFSVLVLVGLFNKVHKVTNKRRLNLDKLFSICRRWGNEGLSPLRNHQQHIYHPVEILSRVNVHRLLWLSCAPGLEVDL